MSTWAVEFAPLNKRSPVGFRTAASDITPPAMDSFEVKLEVVVVVHQGNCLLDVIAPLVPMVSAAPRS